MSDYLQLPAPAKLNLFLYVLQRRADGYHNLQTLFQLLDFGDKLTFERTSTDTIAFTTNVPALSANNLVERAARLLQHQTKTRFGARIHLDKQLPHGGGLGGGSSDAATALLALNRLWGTGLPLSALAQTGVALGADIPVFVYGHSAYAEGVGDQLTPVEIEPLHFLVVTPSESVSTAKVFQNTQLTRRNDAIKIPALSKGGRLLPSDLPAQNDCQSLVRKISPEVDRALNWCSQFGDPLMSGTGASVFLSFTDKNCAIACAKQVPEDWTSFVARGVNRSPVHQILGMEKA